MKSRIEDRNIWLIYGATLLLALAYGISISVLGLFLDAKGYGKGDIGTLAAWFAGGIAALALPMGGLIRRFSARRTLTVALFGYAVVVTAFPFLPNYWSIAAVRVVDGAFSVGVWVSSETILLSRSGKTNKAFVTSLYAIAMAAGYVIGPVISTLVVGASTMTAAFVTAGGFAVLAGLAVLLRLDPDVQHEPEPSGESDEGSASASGGGSKTPWYTLLYNIKTSCFATFSYGYFQASVVLFLPIYLVSEKHMTPENTILVPAFFAAGMLLFSNVAGRMGDRFGHLLIMRSLGMVGTVMVLGFVFLQSYVPMMIAVFIAGASLASISPVSLALQGVVTPRPDLHRANAMYNVFYAIGMLLGPPTSSAVYELFGPNVMLYHLTGLWTAFVLMTAVFYRDDPRARRAPVLSTPSP